MAPSWDRAQLKGDSIEGGVHHRGLLCSAEEGWMHRHWPAWEGSREEKIADGFWDLAEKEHTGSARALAEMPWKGSGSGVVWRKICWWLNTHMWPGLSISRRFQLTSCPSLVLPIHRFYLLTGSSHEQWWWFGGPVALAPCSLKSLRFLRDPQSHKGRVGRVTLGFPLPPLFNQSNLSLFCFTLQLPWTFIGKKKAISTT